MSERGWMGGRKERGKCIECDKVDNVFSIKHIVQQHGLMDYNTSY